MDEACQPASARRITGVFLDDALRQRSRSVSPAILGVAVSLVGEPVAFMRRLLALMRDLLAKAVDFDPLLRALGASSAGLVALC